MVQKEQCIFYPTPIPTPSTTHSCVLLSTFVFVLFVLAPPGIKPVPLALETWNPKHWTPRELSLSPPLASTIILDFINYV